MKCWIILGIMFALSTAPVHQVVRNLLITCHGSYSGTFFSLIKIIQIVRPLWLYHFHLLPGHLTGSWYLVFRRRQITHAGSAGAYITMGKVQMAYQWDSVKIILYSNVVVFSWALIEREKSIFYLANSLLKFDFDCYSWSQLHGMVLYEAHWNWLKLMIKTINYYLCLLYFQVGGAAITSK